MDVLPRSADELAALLTLAAGERARQGTSGLLNPEIP